MRRVTCRTRTCRNNVRFVSNCPSRRAERAAVFFRPAYDRSPHGAKRNAGLSPVLPDFAALHPGYVRVTRAVLRFVGLVPKFRSLDETDHLIGHRSFDIGIIRLASVIPVEANDLVPVGKMHCELIGLETHHRLLRRMSLPVGLPAYHERLGE